jgi:endogenous inhibitor of DNA gyrase (YacG/DUF329 family)
MTLEEKSKIYQLKKEGYGYKKIASELGISVSSVQSFLKRNPVDIDLLGTCKRCGMTIQSIKGKKRKQFCCDRCRWDWWNSHIKEVNKKAFYTLTCKRCGKEFTAYGNQKRVYCCHDCYIKDKKVTSHE